MWKGDAYGPESVEQPLYLHAIFSSHFVCGRHRTVQNWMYNDFPIKLF